MHSINLPPVTQRFSKSFLLEFAGTNMFKDGGITQRSIGMHSQGKVLIPVTRPKRLLCRRACGIIRYLIGTPRTSSQRNDKNHQPNSSGLQGHGQSPCAHCVERCEESPSSLDSVPYVNVARRKVFMKKYQAKTT